VTLLAGDHLDTLVDLLGRAVVAAAKLALHALQVRAGAVLIRPGF
jgi:hypothetical protein